MSIESLQAEGIIPLSKEQLYEKCRSLIVAAVPNIDYTENICTECDGSMCKGLVRHTRDVRLADVLRAIGETGFPLLVTTKGELYGMEQMCRSIEPSNIHWSLAADDLRLQSEETLEFIIKLLEK